MKKLLVIVTVVLLLIILIPLTIIGVVPGLSGLIGAGPKDLGIRITSADSVAARTKAGIEIIPLPKETAVNESFRLEGIKTAEFTMDSRELTAHSNNRPWANYPVKNVQIKIYPDGTIESSGILIISKALPYAMGLGYSETQIKDAINKYKIPPFEVPIYIKGKGSVANDKVTVDAQNISIGAIAIPGDIVSKANSEAESVLDDVISKHSKNFHADSVTFSDGKMNFKGQLPEKEFVVTE